MSDHHTAGPLRHHSDKHFTVPTKPGSQIGILGDGFVRKMSAGQHTYDEGSPCDGALVLLVALHLALPPATTADSCDPSVVIDP
jgi:hypothetical protein